MVSPIPGLEWACFADIRIAEEHASFGVTCRRWNLGLADGGTQRLPRIIGMGRAMELIITGRVIDTQETHRIGLVNEIVPKGRSLERALELAKFIADCLNLQFVRTTRRRSADLASRWLRGFASRPPAFFDL